MKSRWTWITAAFLASIVVGTYTYLSTRPATKQAVTIQPTAQPSVDDILERLRTGMNQEEVIHTVESAGGTLLRRFAAGSGGVWLLQFGVGPHVLTLDVFESQSDRFFPRTQPSIDARTGIVIMPPSGWGDTYSLVEGLAASQPEGTPLRPPTAEPPTPTSTAAAE